MANGLYGTVRPAIVNIDNDVEIFYNYRKTRGSDADDFKALDSDNLVESKVDGANGTSILGLYNLKLPLDVFNKKGIYTIYIRPKEIPVKLTDVSVLAAYPDIKGCVFTMSDLGGISDLTGYLIQYCDTNGERTEVTRLITSSNVCEPVLVTISDSYPKATRYRLTENSSGLLFCTVTPSAEASYKPNVTPFIGTPGGDVILTNTKFNPVMLEIEMVDHDEDTITYMLEGDQIRNRDKSIITTYNDDKEIYLQQTTYTIKDSLGKALYDVKQKMENIENENYDDIVY